MLLRFNEQIEVVLLQGSRADETVYAQHRTLPSWQTEMKYEMISNPNPTGLDL